MVHFRLLHIHNDSSYIQFLDENENGNESMGYAKNHVVRLCTLMSYDYVISCRTFIATIVVRHDNLIKSIMIFALLHQSDAHRTHSDEAFLV